jgi:hypothetical protein
VLKTFLQDNYTCPQLANTLIDTLYCNLHDARYPAFRNRHGANEPQFRKLHQLQAFVGWSQIFQGRLVQECWSILQEEFLVANNAELKLDRRYYTGEIWACKLINLLVYGGQSGHNYITAMRTDTAGLKKKTTP